ncbi:MAG: hypothetical protein DLM59_01140 [Pseudonocardiales bacterium]|nr:MAG: hypothetical protein DLM59_01140 [Pseudonocardiales bacterium]
MFLDALGALGGAERLAGAAAGWQSIWGPVGGQIAALEARAVFGDDSGGRQLREMYWSYARPLRESADGIAKDCQTLADDCRTGVENIKGMDHSLAAQQQA